MKIPFCNLSTGWGAPGAIRRGMDHYGQMALKIHQSGVFLNGPYVKEFELAWARYCGKSFCVSCASGTDALMFLVGAHDRPGRGSQWEIPANGCIFTDVACEKSGIPHRLVDVLIDGRPQPTFYTLDVLLYGRFPHYQSRVSKIVDACQAHGWKPPAGIDAAFSFYPTKNLGAFGDGGCIVTDDVQIADHIRARATGWHSRMNELTAACLLSRLPYLDELNAMRRTIADVYYNELEEIPGQLRFATRPGEPSNFHIFAILSERREELRHKLSEMDVETKVHYDRLYPPHFEGARLWCSQTLSLPCYPGLNPEQVRYVCDCIKTILRD